MKISACLFLFLALSVAAFGQQNRTKNVVENFTATALDGQTFDLAGLKGKVVLITFTLSRLTLSDSVIRKNRRRLIIQSLRKPV
jgi:hypothetical protein